MDVWITWPTERGCGFLNTSQNKAYGPQCWMMPWWKLQMKHIYNVPWPHCHCSFRTLPLSKHLAGTYVYCLCCGELTGTRPKFTHYLNRWLYICVPITHTSKANRNLLWVAAKINYKTNELSEGGFVLSIQLISTVNGSYQLPYIKQMSFCGRSENQQQLSMTWMSYAVSVGATTHVRSLNAGQYFHLP